MFTFPVNPARHMNPVKPIQPRPPMKKLSFSAFFPPAVRFSALVALASVFAATAATAATPSVCSPYSFVGRITDARGIAFDGTRVATLAATAADGTLLARSKTFYREDSTRNYALFIPMATSAANGCALLGDTVAVSATDSGGRVWSAVIDPAIIGTPGEVAVVDIVLADDENGDGIDDTLFATLAAAWENYTDNFDPSATYDPHSDSDGDGVSDIDEALLGTDPFDETDYLAIREFKYSPRPAVTFETSGGHTYAVEVSSTLDPATAVWTPVPISTSAADTNATRSFHTTPATAPHAGVPRDLYPPSAPAGERQAPPKQPPDQKRPVDKTPPSPA